MSSFCCPGLLLLTAQRLRRFAIRMRGGQEATQAASCPPLIQVSHRRGRGMQKVQAVLYWCQEISIIVSKQEVSPYGSLR